MPETLISVDLKASPYDNPQIHNRWHPDIPMACWVKPGDDFILKRLTGRADLSRTMTAQMTCEISIFPLFIFVGSSRRQGRRAW